MAMARAAIRATMLALLMLCLGGCGLGRANLRNADGVLAPCEAGPHCVSSLSEDANRRVEPLRYHGARDAAHARLLALLVRQPRHRIVTNAPDYVHVEVTTPLMRYVDDLEFLFALDAPRIDVRSSSRIGYYDFQTNRARVESLRVRFEQP